jgi:hypothetical protein
MSTTQDHKASAALTGKTDERHPEIPRNPPFPIKTKPATAFRRSHHMAMIAIRTAPRRIAQLAAGTALATLLATAALAQTTTGTIQIRPPTAADVSPQDVQPSMLPELFAEELRPILPRIDMLEGNLRVCLSQAAAIRPGSDTPEASACWVENATSNAALYGELGTTFTEASARFHAAAEAIGLDIAQEERRRRALQAEAERAANQLEALLAAFEADYERLSTTPRDQWSHQEPLNRYAIQEQENIVADLKLSVATASFMVEAHHSRRDAYRDWAWGLHGMGQVYALAARREEHCAWRLVEEMADAPRSSIMRPRCARATTTFGLR